MPIGTQAIPEGQRICIRRQLIEAQISLKTRVISDHPEQLPDPCVVQRK